MSGERATSARDRSLVHRERGKNRDRGKPRKPNVRRLGDVRDREFFVSKEISAGFLRESRVVSKIISVENVRSERVPTKKRPSRAFIIASDSILRVRKDLDRDSGTNSNLDLIFAVFKKLTIYHSR